MIGLLKIGRVVFLLYFFISCSGNALQAGTVAQVSKPIISNKSLVDLVIDQKKGARIFYSNMLVAPSVGGQFDFFKIGLNGHRKRLYSRPAPDKAKEQFITDESIRYIFKGTNPSSDLAYTVEYEKIGTAQWQISFSFKAIKQFGTIVSFEILTLSDDLFRGAKVLSTPHMRFDLDEIPMEPKELEDRFLLKNKRKIVISAEMNDIEIISLNNAPLVGMADFRKVHWAKFKGIYFYGSKALLIPGEAYKFSYKIRISPNRLQKNKQNHIKPPLVLKNEDSLFSQLPKEKKTGPGAYKILKSTRIFGNPDGTAEQILQKKLMEEHQISSTIEPHFAGGYKSGISISKVSKNDTLLPAEGFLLKATTDSITIVGADDRGCLYGVWALLAEIKEDSSVPCVEIQDWPDIAKRGLCVSSNFVRGGKNILLYQRYLEAISRARGNYVAFYHKPVEIRAWLNGENSSEYWSEDEMLEIVKYARFLKLDIWSGMISKFNYKQFPEITILKGTNIYDPKEESSYRFLFSLYTKILNTYQPTHFIIGHDEIKGLKKYSEKYDVSTASLFLQDIKAIHQWMTDKSVRTAMWGDMLLNSKKWGADGIPANSENHLLDSGPTHDCIDDIPKDILILDWHYDKKQKYKTIDFFMQKDLDVFGASYHDPWAASSMSQSINYYKADGMMGTNWGFWRTLSPSATTLYSLLCSWSTILSPGDLDEDVVLMGELLRSPTHKSWEKRTPIDLSAIFNSTIMDEHANDGIGFLDFGPVLDLRSLSDSEGWIEGDNVGLTEVNTPNCIILRNNLTIPFDIPFKADALAFLHTAYFKEPSVVSSEIGSYRIGYENGEYKTIKLINGYNITDVRSNPGVRKNPWPFSRRPEVLTGSQVAWQGHSTAGIPLNIQKMVFINSYPEIPINSITINLKQDQDSTTFIIIGIMALNGHHE